MTDIIEAVQVATSNTSTTSLTFVDLLSVVITCPAGGADVLIWASVTTTASAALQGQFQVLFDGVLLDNNLVDHSIETTAICRLIQTANPGAAAGNHTVKLQWATSANTITVPSSGARALLTVLQSIP